MVEAPNVIAGLIKTKPQIISRDKTSGVNTSRCPLPPFRRCRWLWTCPAGPGSPGTSCPPHGLVLGSVARGGPGKTPVLGSPRRVLWTQKRQCGPGPQAAGHRWGPQGARPSCRDSWQCVLGGQPWCCAPECWGQMCWVPGQPPWGPQSEALPGGSGGAISSPVLPEPGPRGWGGRRPERSATREPGGQVRSGQVRPCSPCPLSQAQFTCRRGGGCRVGSGWSPAAVGGTHVTGGSPIASEVSEQRQLPCVWGPRGAHAGPTVPLKGVVPSCMWRGICFWRWVVQAPGRPNPWELADGLCTPPLPPPPRLAQGGPAPGPGSETAPWGR